MADSPKWLSFDPTIHAGHLMTVGTIIICTIGAYFGILSDITFLKQENGRREAEIAAIKNDAHTAQHNDGVGFFGFFETERDPAIASALFDAAAAWLRVLAMPHGNGRTWRSRRRA